MSRLIEPQFGFWNRKKLPVVLQTEAAECGLACLAMVASFWGHQIDISSIRRRFSVSVHGMNLSSLIQMAHTLDLQARPLKLELEQLSQLKRPCILHWDMNHFVVLKAVSSRWIKIHDPAIGERQFKMSEVSQHFTGVALELTPTPKFGRKNDTQEVTLKSLIGRPEGLKRGLAQVLMMGIALQIFSLLAPFYLQWTVDEALVAADRSLVTVLGLGFLLLVIVQCSVTAVRSWVASTLSTSVNFQWFGRTFAHLMRLPIPYFEKRHVGDIVSRFYSIQTIQQALTTQFVEGVIDGLLVLGTLLVMWLYSAQLAAVSMLAVAIYALVRFGLFSTLRSATAEQIIHMAKQQTHLLESVRGAQTVRLYQREEERRISWMNILAEQFNASLRVSRLTITARTANNLLFGVDRVVVVWLAALAVLKSELSIGMLFAFLSYKDQFSLRAGALIDRLIELKMLRLHGARLADILLTKPEEDDTGAEAQLHALEPNVELRGIGFRYADTEPFVIRGVTLSIPYGQCVAITGESGCGKTTLLKLVLGLLEPTEGDMYVNQLKLKSFGLQNFRRMIGTVMQDDQLLVGSIADNISFFDPSSDMERICNCAGMASISEEIAEMPMGYNTLVGDIGSGLSGGQKQRILLARALYRRPKLLILDEATSHLDIANERLINAAIKKLTLTRILVAHRPDTIAMAQRVIIVGDHGVICDKIQEGENQSLRVLSA